MTPRIVIAIGVVVLIAAVFIAPRLLDYMWFERSVTYAAKAYEANGGSWPQLADACTVCHGHNGDSVNQGYADLAAQPAIYITAQLHGFAQGQRVSPFMGPLALSLSEAEIERLSEHFARQVASNNPLATDPTVSARGEGLSRPCSACHGDGFMGKGLNPRLAGQAYDYLLAQMSAFAANTRNDPTGAMNALAAALSESDRRAVSMYLATFAITEMENSP